MEESKRVEGKQSGSPNARLPGPGLAGSDARNHAEWVIPNLLTCRSLGTWVRGGERMLGGNASSRHGFFAMRAPAKTRFGSEAAQRGASGSCSAKGDAACHR